jgi:type I restriction enzyme S subunit
MESDWQRTTVGAVSLVVTKGTTPTTLGHAFQEAGINFVKVESISPDGRFQTDKLVRISKEAHEALARSQLAPNDVLFTIAGTIGRTAIVTTDILPANTNQAVAIVRPNTALVRPRFLRYVLNNPAFLTGALSRTVESVQANFSLGELKSASILLPDLREQERIVEVLGAIDDRIDLLRQTNATLESIAQALFKSWFIDFDPVRAKAEGREPEGMDAATAALFPAEFEESALDLIPKGWTPGKLEAVCINPRAQAKPGQMPPETPYIGLEHMPRKSIALIDAGTAEGLESSKFWFERNDVLFGKLRPYFHKVGLAPCRGVCSTDILVLRPKATGWLGFLAMHASSDALIAHTTQLSNGARMPRTSWQDVAGFAVTLPPQAIASAFDAVAKPMFDRIHSNIESARVLVAVRDTLLPRLISGKLRLPEAQEQVEEAVA